ncbi:DEAD-box ATP-dependent RNA helicase 57 [Rutidosis leptorrhynchoides]|uniref:DEAD-box ATP-dependent RNA helicase 57 n=1 Tax=Rutidosis leptorrhynchoides TaxID=125765 RepID=UPI003A98EE86
MMDKNPSFLFSGITFNKKKFSADFARFKEKTEINDSEETLFENKIPEVVKVAAKPVKKRKRKSAASDPVKGFNVFKTSKKEPVNEEDEEAINEAQGKKELYRQMERDAKFRKEHNIHTRGSNIPSPLHEFSELRSRYGCKPYILRNLAELGIKEPTPIQMQAMPILLSGRECFACAPTGSGKTLAFVIPMLMKLKRASKEGVRGVIICPTRELASQTYRECKKLAKGKNFYIKMMTKQLSKTGEFSKLTCDILISTPLRLKFAITKRKLDLSRVEYLVLDESDKLFELGLLKQVDAVVKACSNPSIIRSLFSATLPDTVEELARTIMHDAVRVIIGRKNSASELIKQKLVFVGSEEGKLLALRQTFEESLNPPVLIFVQSKERAKDLYQELKFDDIRVDVIHSDLLQVERENAIDNFRAGKTWVLIATDVLARGMDFKGVNCVINYDFPDSSSAYIHRIGRSGRAGRSGEAVTFYTEADTRYLKNIANVMKSSGCEVPEWILSLPKLKWRKHRPKRESLSTKPRNEDEEE